MFFFGSQLLFYATPIQDFMHKPTKKISNLLFVALNSKKFEFFKTKKFLFFKTNCFKFVLILYLQHIKNYIQHTIMEASISLQHFFSDIVTQNLLPMCGYVSAGFPSPAADYIDEQLDLNAYCITNRAATFIVRVSGDSMRDAGIFDTDIAVVDRSLTPKNNDIIIGIIEGEFHWHKHVSDDEFFFVTEGHLYIDIEDPDAEHVRTIELAVGQGVTIPKGVMHRPRAPKKVVMLMVETSSIEPTGD